MNGARPKANRRVAGRAVLGATLALILLVIAGLIYSPWHRHNPAARHTCIFQLLEGSPGLEAGPRIQIDPPVAVIWVAAHEPVPVCRVTPAKPHFDRAPPA